MIEHLKNLVFGLEGYEKVKIDSRFDEIITILPQINIKQLTDFETIEKCIYKLKEHLRIKSSNLNRLIKDSSSTLTKKKVVYVIDTLESLRLRFITTAFNVLETNTNFSSQENTNFEPVKEDEKKEIKEDVKEEIQNSDSIKIYSDSELTVYLNGGKVPYMLVDFNHDINLPLLKYLSSLVFEEIKPQGTNIIVQDNKALIIPRTMNDNLLTLPRVEVNINEVYEKIKSNSKDDKETSEKQERKLETKDEVKEEIKEQVKEETKSEVKEKEYIELDKEKPQINTKKKDEDSLDALLSGIEEKKVDHTPEPKPKEDSSTLQFETGKEIEIEKEEKQIKNEEVKVIDSQSYEIYRDEQIFAYLNQNSTVLGEIIVKNTNEKKNSQLNESELSYISIFSKVFATVLFEVAGAQGTNIMWSFNDNSVRIVPRYQNDNLKINWEPKQSSDDFLEQIRNKMLDEMRKEVQEEKEEETKVQTQKETSNQKNMNYNSNENLSQKAQYILDSLKRMP